MRSARSSDEDLLEFSDSNSYEESSEDCNSSYEDETPEGAHALSRQVSSADIHAPSTSGISHGSGSSTMSSDNGDTVTGDVRAHPQITSTTFTV